MEDKELINKIQALKAIKPTSEWAFWLKSNIIERKIQLHIQKNHQFQLASFSFFPHYAKRLVPAVIAVFFVFSFTYAQTTLPGNPFYPVKTLTQNTRLYLAPANQKPVVRLEIAKIRINDLMEVENHRKAIASAVQGARKNIEDVPQDIKNISSKKLALDISKRVQSNVKDLSQIVDRTRLSSEDKDSLNESIDNTQKEVLTFIYDTTEEINHCPSYLGNRLLEVETYFANTPQVFQNWTLGEINKVRGLLSEASALVKEGKCLEAKEKIESINHLIEIHSADVPSASESTISGESNPVEDTNFSPSSD